MKTLRTSALMILSAVCIPTSLWAQRTEGTEDPGIHRPVTTTELETLRHQIDSETKSDVEPLFEYHSESGDLNNRLDFSRYGARINLRRSPGATVYFSGAHTRYLMPAGFLQNSGTNFTGGFRGKPSESVDLQVEAGATSFSTDTVTVNALGAVYFKPNDETNLYIRGSRTNVEDSMLSATGLRPRFGPFAGQLVGRIMENRIAGGLQQKLAYNLDFFADAGAGTRAGSAVDSNFFKDAQAGVAYNIVANPPEYSLNLVSVGYRFSYFGFDEDRFGFGGASFIGRRNQTVSLGSLGTDGISPEPTSAHAGIGGYFSPRRYFSNVGRLDVQGHPDAQFSYRVSGFAGTQSYTGSDIRSVYGMSATAEVVFSEHASLPVSYFFDNFGPFSQQSLIARLVLKF